jgi:hypothetical protein
MVVSGSGEASHTGGLDEPDDNAGAASTGPRTATPTPASSSTFNEDIGDAYPGDVEGMFDAARKEGIRRIVESVDKDLRKKDENEKDRNPGAAGTPAPPFAGNHTTGPGQCGCGQTHPNDHTWNPNVTCFCGKSGIHGVGTGRD